MKPSIGPGEASGKWALRTTPATRCGGSSGVRLNDDFSRPVIVTASRHDWLPSPAPGVERRMLFRIGEEKARATSIVRYAPNSAFSPHVHSGGEEFLVLDGVFQDEQGDYPAGSYVRNPPGTSHAPRSEGGCTIFVRLWQFRAEDDVPVVRLPGEGQRVAARARRSTAAVLFRDEHEEVRLEEWRPGASVTVANAAGLELLLVSGNLLLDGVGLQPQDWARLPAATDLHAEAGEEGARVWLRRGPLLHPDVCRF